ncbi:MAG TPA: response regulator [Pontiellaceae bacterium]|nr:response regulator [Pontiellaceae bacterium]HPR83348.1 response regulator [Pontiellaceae bacterium]
MKNETKKNGPLILVIDDEASVRRMLRYALEGHGYRVQETATGETGLTEAATCSPDTIVLDLGLPDMDGAQVLRRLREWSAVPVLILSVRDEPDDKVDALDAGADDYVTKPFDTEELLARLRAIQRRARTGESAPVIVVGKLEVDMPSHAVRIHGQELKLSPIEFSLLRVLAQHAGRIVTHRTILREVWGPKSEEQSQYLRVHFTHIRRKLKEAGLESPSVINEPGIGYRLAGE